MRFFFIVCVGFALNLSASPGPLLAIRHSGGPIRWATIGSFLENKNPPLIMVSRSFPIEPQADLPGFPPGHIPVLLQVELSPVPGFYNRDNLDNLSKLLMAHKNISHLSLRGWEQIAGFKRLSYIIKTISSLTRGILPGVKIALACPDSPGSPGLIAVIQALSTNPDTFPYFDCFFLAAAGHEEIRRNITRSSPHIRFWERISARDEQPSQTLSRLMEGNLFSKPATSLWVIPTDKTEILYRSLLRFSGYLNQGLYQDGTGIRVTDTEAGASQQLPLFYSAADQLPVLFLGGDGRKKVRISFKKGLYQKAHVKNLTGGKEALFKITRGATALELGVYGDFFAVHFFPRKQKLTGNRHHVSVSGSYRLSAEEIIARVRAWKARRKSLVKTFTATMTTSLRLRIGNLKQTFDLTIKGPVFSERDKPYDWVWQEFYLNGVEWKSKRVPKIPLLQPEKVNIMPLDINLTEEYDYSLGGETTTAGKKVYIVDFQPRKGIETASLYRGRIRVEAGTFALLREHLVQLNLKGEVLANVETRYFKPVRENGSIRLPLSVVGHQVFSTAGRVTNVERNVTLTDIVINPENFQALKEQALQSKFQVVRDTRKGLRYLVKDKKSGRRKVEWQTKKSQLFGVLGGFYDSSIGYPIPMLGFNYMNFNLGGTDRQVNVLFGGVILTANYSDPSFLGTKMDIGANVIAVAFPLKNRLYHRNSDTEIEAERVKRLPLRFQVSSGFPLGTHLKYSSMFLFDYNTFSLAETTAGDFVLPQDTLTAGWLSQFTFNVKGYRLSLWGEISRRLRWNPWGIPGSDYFDPDQQSYLRWRAVLDKDFFLSPFKKIHLTAAYFDGFRLDRFSAYKFGFFNELNLHGYMSGVVQATRAYLINLSYGYSLGKSFNLELFYDSSWVTNPLNDYRSTYFSGAALSGTMNIPGLNGILRFEAGMPVVNNGIKGVFVYFIFLKMF